MAVPPGSTIRTSFKRRAGGQDELMSRVSDEFQQNIGASVLGKLRDASDRRRLIISLYNNKGGVLKSTSTAEMAFTLSNAGFNVAAVDLDSQCSLTKALMKLELPDDSVDITTRVRVNDAPLPLDGENQEPIFYTIYDGLTEVARPADPDTLPVPVTPLKLRSAGPPDIDNDFEGKDNKATRLQVFLDDMLPDNVGSVHLVVGHHKTGTISNHIAHAILQKTVNLQRIHGSIHWLLKKIAEDVDADIVLVDLNPDACELNRTVIMQSDYVLVPSWPDMDGVECVVDLQCRILEGLTVPSVHINNQDHHRNNEFAWAQKQLDLIQDAARVIPAHHHAHLRVRTTFPKFLGLMLHSKESDRTIPSDHERFAKEMDRRFKRMCGKFRGTGDGDCWLVNVRQGNQIQNLPHLSDMNNAGATNKLMSVEFEGVNPPCYSVVGGMWNLEGLKTVAKEVLKPLAVITIHDLDHKDGKYSKALERNMEQLVEMRHRLWSMGRAILHNIQWDLMSTRLIPPPGQQG